MNYAVGSITFGEGFDVASSRSGRFEQRWFSTKIKIALGIHAVVDHETFNMIVPPIINYPADPIGRLSKPETSSVRPRDEKPASPRVSAQGNPQGT